VFVIQEKVRPWKSEYEKPYPHQRYKTLEEARTAFDSLPKIIQVNSRIAEEYTVTRYKAVK